MAAGPATITAYHEAQSAEDRAICARLKDEIAAGLPEAIGKIWHAHPVWFLAGNPIVGYGKLKACIRLMFWSGQSFTTPGLTKTGTFKAAEKRFNSADQVNAEQMQSWLSEARDIQWDYKNIAKRKGELIRLSPT